MSPAELFSLPFMQRALLAALFTGLAAPVIGTYLVQRRLALMGDGLGHVAVTGVAVGLLTGYSPTWTAVAVAILGAIAIEVGALPSPPAGSISVAIVPLPLAPGDIRLRHKSSDRAFYDIARRASGAAEVVFESDGVLTEGSFTSLFVERADGMLVTPPLSRGLLPGILRGEMIESGHAIEGDVTVTDLARGFFVGNAVRGLMRAHVADANDGAL